MQTPEMYYGVDCPTNTTDAFSQRKAMLSAGMVWKMGENFNFTVPETRELFVDSGGFQAVSSWGLEYPYTTKKLFDWAESIDADLLACPDFACEPELHSSSVEKRIELTIEHHAEAMALYEDGDYSFELVPVLQGYYADQYQYCINRFKDEGFVRDYMAIGTVCKRDSPDAIHKVMETIESGLPNTDFHMFGMTLNAWKDTRMWGRFKSADTAAWNWGGQTQAHKVELLTEYADKVDAIRDKIGGQTKLC